MKIDFEQMERNIKADREAKEEAFKNVMQKEQSKTIKAAEELAGLFSKAINNITEAEEQDTLQKIEEEKKTVEQQLKAKYHNKLPKEDNEPLRELSRNLNF